MGDLGIFNIGDIKEEYSLSYYVETGTGHGTCLDRALQFGFEKYFSVEIFKKIFDDATIKYSNVSNLRLINDSSENALRLLKYFIDKPCLFFLDAHFPGADFGFAGYDSTSDRNLRIPLENEIEILKSYSVINKSYIIIDDLRIYEDGPFTGGNWPERKQLGGDGIDFITNTFFSSHDISKIYEHQGYIILKPKK